MISPGQLVNLKGTNLLELACYVVNSFCSKHYQLVISYTLCLLCDLTVKSKQ